MHCFGHFRVFVAVHFLEDGQGLPVERLGLAELPLVPLQRAQIVRPDCNMFVWRVTVYFFGDRYGLRVERLGFGVFSLKFYH